MRLSEDLPLDPVVLAELEAIDATLRGEAVDPAHAELAELALLLAADRPQLPAQAARSLDAAVARRFAPVVAGPRAGGDAYAGDRAGADTGTGGRGGRGSGARLRGWARRPAFGLALAGVAAVAVAGVAVVSLGQTGGSRPLSLATASTASGTTASTAAGTSASAGGGASYALAHAPARKQLQTGASGSASHGAQAGALGAVGAAGTASRSPATAKAAASTPAVATPSSAGQTESLFPPPSAQTVTANGAPAPAPASNGRKTIQSAQLQLVTSGDRIDQVSQEVFDVIGLEDGIVKSSTITAAGGNNGYASFQLSIPSTNLATTMTQLSELRYAHVASRTDATQDVNGQYLSDVRALADAQALRTALLGQLANATTQAQIDSLTTQIHDADATIAADQATLSSLNGRISYSQLQVQINAGTLVSPTPSTGSSGGFTLGKAWHDAVRVLTVAAGVGLIALAALLPFALMVALLLWILSAVRRHRREAALDAA